MEPNWSRFSHTLIAAWLHNEEILLARSFDVTDRRQQEGGVAHPDVTISRDCVNHRFLCLPPQRSQPSVVEWIKCFLSSDGFRVTFYAHPFYAFHYLRKSNANLLQAILNSTLLLPIIPTRSFAIA